MKFEKLVKKLISNPSEARISDLEKVLEYFGWKRVKIKGSHHIYIKDENIITLPVHNKKVKRVYIKRFIEKLRLEEWYEKNFREK